MVESSFHVNMGRARSFMRSFAIESIPIVSKSFVGVVSNSGLAKAQAAKAQVVVPGISRRAN